MQSELSALQVGIYISFQIPNNVCGPGTALWGNDFDACQRPMFIKNCTDECNRLRSSSIRSSNNCEHIYHETELQRFSYTRRITLGMKYLDLSLRNIQEQMKFCEMICLYILHSFIILKLFIKQNCMVICLKSKKIQSEESGDYCMFYSMAKVEPGWIQEPGVSSGLTRVQES